MLDKIKKIFGKKEIFNPIVGNGGSPKTKVNVSIPPIKIYANQVPPPKPFSKNHSKGHEMYITGMVFVSGLAPNFGAAGMSGQIHSTGFPYNIPNFGDYAQTTTDNRPDFEKAYDVYVKNKEANKTIDPKQQFVEACKIAYAIAKLENN